MVAEGRSMNFEDVEYLTGRTGTLGMPGASFPGPAFRAPAPNNADGISTGSVAGPFNSDWKRVDAVNPRVGGDILVFGPPGNIHSTYYLASRALMADVPFVQFNIGTVNVGTATSGTWTLFNTLVSTWSEGSPELRVRPVIILESNVSLVRGPEGGPHTLVQE